MEAVSRGGSIVVDFPLHVDRVSRFGDVSAFRKDRVEGVVVERPIEEFVDELNFVPGCENSADRAEKAEDGEDHGNDDDLRLVRIQRDRSLVVDGGLNAELRQSLERGRYGRNDNAAYSLDLAVPAELIEVLARKDTDGADERAVDDDERPRKDHDGRIDNF